MDLSNVCEECGKAFADSARLFTHQRKSCRSNKRTLQDLLSGARDLWKAKHSRPKKCAKLSESAPILGSQGASGGPLSYSNDSEPAPSGVGDSSQPHAPCSPTPCSPRPLETSNNSTFDPPPPARGLSHGIATVGEGIELSSEPPSQPESRWTTLRDLFGLFKRFDSYPSSHNPDTTTSYQCEPADLNGPASNGDDDVAMQDLHNLPVTQPLGTLDFHPYPNWSSFELGDLLWSRGPIQSLDQFNDLIRLFRNPDFKLDDVCHADWTRIHTELAQGKQLGLDTNADWVDDIGPGWTTTRITFDVPFPTQGQGPNVKTFDTGVLHHRKIVSVLKERLTNPSEHRTRHYQAHGLFWQPDLSKDPIQVYGEVYTSEEFRKMEEEVRHLTLEKDDDRGLERVVVALMFWTDATLLANFGTAKLWPCYMFFGNDSKYLRASPNSNLCNHIAYFDSLPDHFKDWYRAQSNGRNPSQPLIAHLNREILHRQWDILLDDELMQAMKNGIRLSCPDNVTRLFFPRPFTYSADYPEKANIATIRALGIAPCPRCTMKKCDMHGMGSDGDMLARISGRRVDNPSRQEKVRLARYMIFDEGYAVNSSYVDAFLPKSGSMVPTENAFSKLSPFGFSVYSSLVVDLMHEFELGVWKAIFIHLIRILQAEGSFVVSELDQRSEIPPQPYSTSGSLTIKQSAIPVFDQLLPEPHNTIILKLLFVLAEWHALAKLRMHTELTVNLLEVKTAELASSIRTFMEVTCDVYKTVETRKEYTTRLRRAAKKAREPGATPETLRPTDANLNIGSSHLQAEASTPLSTPATTRQGRLQKTLNIQTYKYHALADYAEHIRRFGTTDSYSTERGELEHKLPKLWFLCTNKKGYRQQLARIERRRANLRKIRQKTNSKDPAKLRKRNNPVAGRFCSYVIAKSQSNHESLLQFIPQEANGKDPALKDFLPELQEHVPLRMEAILRHEHPERFVEGNGLEPIDKSYMSVVEGRIYTHKTAHLSYSTYDGRKGDDILWPSCAKANIMLLNPRRSSAEDHPFIYGKVLGIYHINVVYVKGFQDLPPRRLDFLWVRWYQWRGKSAGACSLDLVAFPPVTEAGSFGFADPGEVLRACHIIPRFPERPPVPGESLSRKAEDTGDYATYFVNRFADRDIFMRYQWGYAVGHCYSHGNTPLPSPAAVPLVIPPPRSAETMDHPNQQEEDQLVEVDDDQLDLLCNGDDEMVYERSDVECSDEEEENQNTGNSGSEPESEEE